MTYYQGHTGPVEASEVRRNLRKPFTDLFRYSIIFVVIATAIYRLGVEQEGVRKEDLFKDWGHLLAGLLIGLWAMGRCYRVGWYKLWFWLMVVVTAAEVVAWVVEGKKLL